MSTHVHQTECTGPQGGKFWGDHYRDPYVLDYYARTLLSALLHSFRIYLFISVLQ